jgi:hypothetical protein
VARRRKIAEAAATSQYREHYVVSRKFNPALSGWR